MKILVDKVNKPKKRLASLYYLILTFLFLLIGAISVEAIAQQTEKTITGLVTDADGNPVSGVSVAVKGTTIGTFTDVEGKYSIKVHAKNTLEFIYLGYNTEEREIKEETSIINIKMLESSQNLDEVVVVGYGQQKKESVVSAINAIGPKELAVTGRSLTNSIAGQVAGIIAIQPSGEPGYDDSNFWIRGVSSYQGGTSPLVLVDGIPRSMSNITVDEIETFTVLKDAAATAVYGAEGANGVILITSKRGKVQKTSISVKAEETVRTPIRVPELLSSYDYLSLFNEATWNDGIVKPNGDNARNPLIGFTPTYSEDVLMNYYNHVDPDLYPDADWLSMLKKHTYTSRYTVNFRGGNDKVRFFTSGGYYRENGIYNTNPVENYNANLKYERYNLRSNIDMDITKTTKLSIDIGGYYTINNAPRYTADQYFSAFTMFPVHVIPMYYSDGSYSNHPASTADLGSGRINPYNLLNLTGYYKRWTITAQSKVNLEQKLDFITKGLYWKGSASFDAYTESGMQRTKSPTTYYATGRNSDGELIKTQRDAGSALGNPELANSGGNKNIYLETSLNYNHVFNKVHDVTGLLLYNQKETQNQTSSGMNLLPVRKQSVVSRVVYNYDTRYILEANFGMTGSDNFAPGYRWGFFPAVGFAWYASNEKFLEKLKNYYISKLKFRASYGKTGNDKIQFNGSDFRFPYLGSVNSGASGYNWGMTGAGGGGTGSTGGVTEAAYSNPYLRWEVEDKTNFGLDLGLLKGRIDFSIDYFTSKRTDIIVTRLTIPTIAGLRMNPIQNIGCVGNKGFDSNLVYNQNIGEFSLSFRGNITYSNNKIIEMDEVPQRYDYQRQTGHHINQPLLYIAEGLYTPDDFNISIDPQTKGYIYQLKQGLPNPGAAVAPGDIKYKDINGDGVIDSYDMTYYNGFYPSSSPCFVYGFGVNIDWKGFYAGIFLQGVGGVSANILAKSENFMPFVRGPEYQSGRVEALDRWRSADPYNQDVLFPRMHASVFNYNMYNSTWWYRDASFIRLKNVEFGYNFDRKLVGKFFAEGVRLYVQGSNVAVWDKIKYWDPELRGANSGAKYPISGDWTLGLDVSF